MVEKGVRGGTCLCIYRYGKANSKYIKDYDKNKVPSYLQYQAANSLCEWATTQKLPVNNFERMEGTSQFNKNFIKKL